MSTIDWQPRSARAVAFLTIITTQMAEVFPCLHVCQYVLLPLLPGDCLLALRQSNHQLWDIITAFIAEWLATHFPEAAVVANHRLKQLYLRQSLACQGSVHLPGRNRDVPQQHRGIRTSAFFNSLRSGHWCHRHEHCADYVLSLDDIQWLLDQYIAYSTSGIGATAAADVYHLLPVQMRRLEILEGSSGRSRKKFKILSVLHQSLLRHQSVQCILRQCGEAKIRRLATLRRKQRQKQLARKYLLAHGYSEDRTERALKDNLSIEYWSHLWLESSKGFRSLV